MPKEKKTTTPNPPPAPGNGAASTMSEEAVNEYMSLLMGNQNATLPDMEGEVLTLFKSTSLELNKTVQRLKQTQSDAAQLGVSAQRLEGQLNAYVGLLVKAESSRRASQKETA